MTFRAGRIEAIPANSIPYYPRTQPLEEFREPDSIEFREPVDLAKALESSRALAASANAPVRAGALLSETRILRKIGRINDALNALTELVWINGKAHKVNLDLGVLPTMSVNPNGRQIAFSQSYLPGRPGATIRVIENFLPDHKKAATRYDPLRNADLDIKTGYNLDRFTGFLTKWVPLRK